MAIDVSDFNKIPTRSDLREVHDSLEKRLAKLERLAETLVEAVSRLAPDSQAAFSPRQLAGRLGRSKSWVLSMLQEGRITGSQSGHGRGWLIPAEEVERVLGLIRGGEAL